MNEKTTIKLDEQQSKIVETVRTYLQTRLSIDLYDSSTSTHKDNYYLSYPVSTRQYGIFKHIIKSCTVDISFYEFLGKPKDVNTIRISVNLAYKHYGGGSNGHSMNFSLNYYLNNNCLVEAESN